MADYTLQDIVAALPKELQAKAVAKIALKRQAQQQISTVYVPGLGVQYTEPGESRADYYQGLMGQAAQGATLGAADEAAAGVRSLLPGFQDYSSELSAIRQGDAQFQGNHPYISFAAQVAGGAPAGAAIGGGGSLTRQMLTAGATGAATGFASGEGGQDNRLSSAMTTGAVASFLPPALRGTGWAFGKALEKSGEFFNRFLAVQGDEVLKDPATQKALQIAVNKGELKTPLGAPVEQVSDIKKVTKPVKEAVDRYSTRAQGDLSEQIAAELGADASREATEKAFSKRGREGVQQILRLGRGEVFDVPTVQELGERIGDELEGAFKLRADTLDAAEKFVTSGKLPAQNGQVLVEDLADSADMAKQFSEIADRVTQLNKSGRMRGKASAMVREVRILQNDFRRLRQKGGASIRDALEMVENLNEFRRIYAKEFTSSNVAKKIDKNAPSYGTYEGSLEAVAKLQDGLYDAIEASLRRLKTAGADVDPAAIRRSSETISAFRNLGGLEQKFRQAYRRGIAFRDPSAAIQNPGGKLPLNVFTAPIGPGSARANVGGVMNTLREMMPDVRSEVAERSAAVDQASPRAMQNIQNLMYLSKNLPAQSPPDSEVAPLINLLMGLGRGTAAGSKQLKNAPPTMWAELAQALAQNKTGGQ